MDSNFIDVTQHSKEVVILNSNPLDEAIQQDMIFLILSRANLAQEKYIGSALVITVLTQLNLMW